MTVFITGGAGFLGCHLVDRHLARGDRVIVADSFITGRQVNLAHHADNPALTLLDLDISATRDHPALETTIDRVYHLASPASPVHYLRYPIETMRANSDGTGNALEIARRNGARFVLASTSEVYGDPLVHPQPETYWGNVNPIGPRSCYDEGKRFAESLTMAYCRHHGLDTRIARIFNTYGPRTAPDDGRVVPNFCVQALRSEPITLYGDGGQTRSFCYVDDLVDGMLALGDGVGLDGEVMNLGNPDEVTIRAVAETVVRLAGGNAAINFLPLPTDDPAQRCPDIAHARSLLGWSPKIGLEDGLRSTIAHFRDLLG
jgi:nucleoside-diphosphate-sugar epimerase